MSLSKFVFISSLGWPTLLEQASRYAPQFTTPVSVPPLLVPRPPHAPQGNTGRQSGAVYLHGHLDGATPSLGCDLTLRGVTLARNGGHQAGAMQAS